VSLRPLDYLFPQEWEYQFTEEQMKPIDQCQSDLERFGLARCAFCGDLIHQDEASHRIYYDDDGQHTKLFCGEHCKTEDYLWRIRKEG